MIILALVSILWQWPKRLQIISFDIYPRLYESDGTSKVTVQLLISKQQSQSSMGHWVKNTNILKNYCCLWIRQNTGSVYFDQAQSCCFFLFVYLEYNIQIIPKKHWVRQTIPLKANSDVMFYWSVGKMRPNLSERGKKGADVKEYSRTGHYLSIKIIDVLFLPFTSKMWSKV